MKKIFFLIYIFILLSNLLHADDSLYKDYKTPKKKNLIERIGMEFGYNYIQTNGIDAHERFGFDKDISTIGTDMSFSYLLWEPDDAFDLSASINWSYQEPDYMGLTYYGLRGRYYFNQNNAIRFMYAHAIQGEIGGDERAIELGTGHLWGIGYEYKLNNIYRFFFDYKKASLKGSNFVANSIWLTEETKYNVDIFSMGLGANFIFNKKNTNYINSDGEIEDMSISLGYVTDSINLEIKDKTDTLNYTTKNQTSIPIIIKGKSRFLNKSNTLGYKLFSVGFNLVDYSKKASHYYLRGVPEEVVGHTIYIAPSLFYTNSFRFMNIDHSWKIEASTGAGFLTLDAKNLNNLDTKNKLGTYNSLSAEIGMKLFNKKDFFILRYSYIKQEYDNNGIKYNIDGNSIGMHFNFRFKDIFSKDW